MTGPTTDQRFQVGQVLAQRYELLALLGKGGNGAVYRVNDTVLADDRVALKLLVPARSADVRTTTGRFRNEFLVARRLSHPNILRLYDFGETDSGQSYISMEYVEGECLFDRIRRRSEEPLSFEDILNILLQLSSALAFTHAQGIIHRDMKPENVLLMEGGKLKLTDFGIARSQDSTSGLTQTGEGLGTPIYMAPEQVNAKYVDYRADIYSLGIMAYELVAGDPPFGGRNWQELVTQHLSEPMPSLIDRGFDVPPWYDEMVLRATEKAPADRFQSALEIRDVIAAHIPAEQLRRDPTNIVVRESPAVAGAIGPLTMVVGAVMLVALLAMAGIPWLLP